ncbi:hypothetical protein Sme01_19060 [Sphaerisporangium melleum]|uniref:Uncharacterized protein n=1 Tax=Sphaerisporangium melleum TaxID=321316 RepID=A0A917REL4_9ACTN|nr:hypothetical protein GCM10007964_51590 [Sphaerisporangium melleum]GII69430.1 hypothetical protein Sme01_19060 [Sphaerisporangium melleum]
MGLGSPVWPRLLIWQWPHAEAYLLVGVLPYSGRWCGWLAPSTDQAHLVEALHEVCWRLGGLTRV